MAKQRVPVNPMQQALGEDYDEETLRNLAMLQGMQDNPEFDVSGTSNPVMPVQQQYQDVPRQMSVRESVTEEDIQPNDTNGLELLGKIAQDEAVEDSLDGLGETQPPPQYQPQGMEQPQMEVQEQDLSVIPDDESGNMIDPFEQIRIRVQEEPDLLNYLPEETRKLLQNPNSVEAQKLVADAQEMTTPTVGATEAGLNDPKIMSLAKRLDGMSEDSGYPPEIQKNALLWEEYFNKENQNISDEAEKLGRKAQNGELTQEEIIALGIATIIPALLSLVYGKEAALGAIGGGLEGAAKYMEGKQQGAADASKGLKELEKKKIDLIDKDLKFKQDFEKTITDPEVRKLVKERGYETLPEYGTVGIKVLPELGVYLNGDITNTDAEEFKKEWPEDRKDFAKQKELDTALADIDDIMDVIREIDPSYYNVFLSKIKGYDSAGLLKAWGKTVPDVEMMIDGKIEKVNPLQQLSAMINKLQSTYIVQQKLGGKLTDNVKVHMDSQIGDASNPVSWITSNATDLQAKVKRLRNTTNRDFVEGAVARGYVRGPLSAQYPSSEMQVYRSSDPVQEQLKRQIVNSQDINYLITQ